MTGMTKEEFVTRSQRFLNAFQHLANMVEKDHAILKVMGSLAWRRHGAECGPDAQTIRGRAVEYGYLKGCKEMLVKWCNANKEFTVRKLLLDILENLER